jgi:hypothetical protein
MKSGGIMADAKFPNFREVLETSAVRQRIVEYLGGTRLDDATCLFLGRLDSLNPSRFERHPPGRLHTLLDESCELSRSLEDRVSMLIHLDIEYVNFDDPSAAYIDPQRIFRLQEPLVEVIEARLLSLGIHYLHVVTGQGHHFVWKIRKCSPVAKAISRLGICNTPNPDHASEPLFPHVALLMEHLAHLLKPEAAAACEIPVEITAQHVGPGRSGTREMLSIDISEYGDPLPSRMIRIPYTVYRKPWISGLIERMGIGEQVPEFFTLPLHEMSIQQLIERRHDPETIIDLAQRAGVVIPLEEPGTRMLLESYRTSGLIHFHRKFYATGHGFPTPEKMTAVARTIDRLPPCAKHVLEFPNDLLLKPSGIQFITRCLLAEGWHPRHIAALVASSFQDPAHDWGPQWDDYDPLMRAEFYVRLFAGQIDQGIEMGVDFNCFSQQEKQFCWDPDNCSLDPIRARVYGFSNPNPPKS